MIWSLNEVEATYDTGLSNLANLEKGEGHRKKMTWSQSEVEAIEAEVNLMSLLTFLKIFCTFN
jgi:hypothetical protein